MKHFAIMTAFLMILSSVAFGQSNAATLVSIQKTLMGWIAILGSISLGVAGGAWVIGDLLKVKFLQHLVEEYKRGVIGMIVLGALLLIFDKELAEVTTKVLDPFNLW